ncbi:DnaJ family domain-containing protein [Jatrophihabitans sp. DSM 45814]
MTKRKPPNVSWGDWVEHQIRDAQNRGGFDDLPGKGKPLPSLKEPHDDMAWIAAKLRRENLSIAAILPPSLALAKEVEDLPERLAKEKSEAAVRAVVLDLNERILQAHRRPQEGPPMRVMTRDVERVVQDWRESHNNANEP